MNPSPVIRNLRTDHQNPTPAVASDGRLSIDLAGTIVEVTSASGSWLSEVRDRYGSFVCDRTEPSTIQLTVQPGRPHPQQHSAHCGGRRPACLGHPQLNSVEATPQITITHTTDEAAMKAQHGCLSIVDPGRRKAEIATRQGTDVLDGVLRILLPSVIAPDVMVHCTLLSDGERGFLCCGISGSGKSTIASLFPEAALCDELARLHVDPEGVEARSLPFWKARSASVALTGVFILEHGGEHRRVRLKASEAIRNLRRHIYWPVEDSDLMAGAAETLLETCRSVPVFRLAFRPDPSVWTVMTEGL